MSEDDKLKMDGKVVACQGNGFFKVAVPTKAEEDSYVLCRLSGKMQKNGIRVVEGDSVTIELGLHDLSKGRITYRKR